MAKAPKFKPHYNREFGKKFYSESDYKDAMKKAGVEPYNPSGIKRPESKPYERSEWARSMHEDIKSRKGRAPGDRFIAELSKRGYDQKRYEQAMRIAKEGAR